MKSWTLRIPEAVKTYWGTTLEGGSSPSIANQNAVDSGLTVTSDVLNGDYVTPNNHEFVAWRSRFYSRSWQLQKHASNPSYSFFRIGPTVGEYPLWWNPDTMTIYPRLYNAALSRIHDQMRGRLDLSIALAEAGKTQRMIRNVSKVLSYAREFRRQFSSMPLKALGGKWLELQYGWKPLVSDVYETGKLLLSPDTLEGNVRARSREKDRNVLSSTVGGQIPIIRVAESSLRCEISLVYQPPGVLADLAKYTSLNPVSIAWELLPYSFVVDWFLQVGDYLRNAESAMLYNTSFVRGYVTYGYKTRARLERIGELNAPPYLNQYMEKGWWEKAHKKREKLLSWPFPKRPSFNIDLGSGRLANAAALLSQFLGRGR